jgi:hypothetical protein
MLRTARRKQQSIGWSAGVLNAVGDELGDEALGVARQTRLVARRVLHRAVERARRPIEPRHVVAVELAVVVEVDDVVTVVDDVVVVGGGRRRTDVTQQMRRDRDANRAH